jgi:hypothetical protein
MAHDSKLPGPVWSIEGDLLITPKDHQSQLNPYPCPLITSGAEVSLYLMWILTHVRVGSDCQLVPYDLYEGEEIF